jgi:hypothetical protein
VPKTKATEESLVQAGWKISFDLTQQKKQNLLLETKDSSSADHLLPNNKVRGRPPQNDKQCPWIIIFPIETWLSSIHEMG